MFEPRNEQGVIVRFVQEYPDMIVSIQTGFPDAIIRNQEGVELRAEFEYCSSNFRQHGHDPRECDIIICWEHDLENTVMPVITLKDKCGMINQDQLPLPSAIEAEYWRERALLAERRAEKMRMVANEQVAQRPAQKARLWLPVKNLGIYQETFDYLSKNPNADRSTMAADMGVSSRTISNHFKQLEELGAIRRDGSTIIVMAETKEFGEP